MDISKLTAVQIRDLSDNEILSLAMERPGHPGQYGFMLQLPDFNSPAHLAETMTALLGRLKNVENLEGRMKGKER